MIVLLITLLWISLGDCVPTIDVGLSPELIPGHNPGLTAGLIPELSPGYNPGLTAVPIPELSPGFNPELTGGLNPGLTAAAKLHGFSGNYGLGGGLGGLTLNDIAYDLSTSYTSATSGVGIKLGLPSQPKINQVFVNPLLLEAQKYGSAQVYTSDVLLEKPLQTIVPTVSGYTSDVLLEKPLQTIVPTDSGYKSDVLLTSHSTPFKTDIRPIYSEPTLPYSRPYLTKLKGGYKYMYFSMGDRLGSKLTSDVPFITSKYSLDGHRISGYTSKVIHTSKPYNGLHGESSVSFTKLHTGPVIQSIPQLKHRTIVEPSVLNSFTSFSPFSYEYPTEYGNAISKRYGISEKNGGFGSLLTGSYGSVLYSGYKSAQLFPDLFKKKK